MLYSESGWSPVAFSSDVRPEDTAAGHAREHCLRVPMASQRGALYAGRAEISEIFEYKQTPACVKRLLCAVGGAEPVASSCVNRDNFVNG